MGLKDINIIEKRKEIINVIKCFYKLEGGYYVRK